MATGLGSTIRLPAYPPTRLFLRCRIKLRGALREHRVGDEAGAGAILALQDNLDAGREDIGDDTIVDDRQAAPSVGDAEADLGGTIRADDRALDDIPGKAHLAAILATGRLEFTDSLIIDVG